MRVLPSPGLIEPPQGLDTLRQDTNLSQRRYGNHGREAESRRSAASGPNTSHLACLFLQYIFQSFLWNTGSFQQVSPSSKNMVIIPLLEDSFSRIIEVNRLTRPKRMGESRSDLTSLQSILDVHRESYYQRLPSSGHDDRLTGIVQYRFGERVHFVNESFLESFIVRRTGVR